MEQISDLVPGVRDDGVCVRMHSVHMHGKTGRICTEVKKVVIYSDMKREAC